MNTFLNYGSEFDSEQHLEHTSALFYNLKFSKYTLIDKIKYMLSDYRENILTCLQVITYKNCFLTHVMNLILNSRSGIIILSILGTIPLYIHI